MASHRATVNSVWSRPIGRSRLALRRVLKFLKQSSFWSQA